MTIDTGFNLSFNTTAPIPGVRQSSKPIRDNFAIIKRAIEALQNIEAGDDSIFAITPLQDSDGSIKLDIGFRNNAFMVPIGDPTVAPSEGMLRLNGGVLQIHNGTTWSIVSGPTIDDIINALAADPDLIELVQSGNLPDLTPAIPDGASGLLTGADKAKLDQLAPAFTHVVARSDAGQQTVAAEFGSSTFTLRAMAPLTMAVSGKELQIGVNLPNSLAIANGAQGYMSGADKAKLDLLVTNDATTTAKGYMTPADKTKLNNLAQSFTRINVNNGPILASETGQFEIIGAGGITVNAIPGQQKLSIALGNIGGFAPATVANVVAAFTASRYRLATAVAATSNEQISHSLNSNATANILFTWTYAGAENEIDFFRITVNESLSSAAYTFGTSLTTERVYDVPALSRSFTLPSATPDHYYTIFVQGVRQVDIDINPTGLMLGAPRKCTTAGKNPYRPETTAVFSGVLSGSLNGMTIDQLLAAIAQAQAGANWSNIIGDDKPDDNADVTSQNTALNTLNVGNMTTAQVLNAISTAQNSITSLQQSITDINTNSGVGSSALQTYVNAAQAAKNAAEAAASQVNTQFTSISQMKIAVELARDIATTAKTAAEAASNAAASSAATLSSAASAAAASATASLASQQLADSSATAASSSASAAQASNLNATLTVAQTRPFDFDRDGLFWDGLTSGGQGATYQDVVGIGRTYRQLGNVPGWITPKRPFLSRAARRIRAVVRCRYFEDGIDTVGQHVELVVKGINGSGQYVDTTKGTIYPIEGKDPGNSLFSIDGWKEFGLDFIADQAFADEFTYFNIWFTWNTEGGLGRIEVSTFFVDDITESGRAEVAATSAITASDAAIVARDDSVTQAQAASASAATATTAAGQANSYRTDAVEAAQTATTAKNTAVQQAGVATSAAEDALTYSNSAAASSASATSEADRAESVADATIAASVTATSAASDATTAASAISGYTTTVVTKASEVEQNAQAVLAAALNVQTNADAALSNAQASATSASTAQTSSTTAQQAATAATQAETLAQSYKDGAETASVAASTFATSAQSNSSLAAQYAGVSETSSISAQLVYAATLPPDFREGGRFWSPQATGTIETRMTLPPTGTYVNDSTYGQIFQSLTQPGTIGPVGMQRLAVGRTYRVTTIVRVLTNNTGGSSLLSFDIKGLDNDLTSVVATLNVGSANPLTYSDGWKVYTKDFVAGDLPTAIYFRPLLIYNQTEGDQVVQVREIRVEDITESKNAQTAASAALTSQTTVLAYKTDTMNYASSAQISSALATTAAGTASSSMSQAASSASDANGYRVAAELAWSNAVVSEGLANEHLTATSGFASSAETSATEASNSAQAAAASALNASLSTGSLVPSGFANDGADWIIENDVATTYQDVPGLGRTAQIEGAGGVSRIMPYNFVLPDPARVYRVTVRARYVVDGTSTADQLCRFAYEGWNPSSLDPVTKMGNDFGVQTATIAVVDDITIFSQDFKMSNTSTQLRPKFEFNAGVSGLGDGTIEILSFRVEDISESERAKVFANASQTSADLAQTYQTDAGSSATSASIDANTAELAAERAIGAAAQSLPYDFSLDSTFFTNDLGGFEPGDVTYGTFVTIP